MIFGSAENFSPDEVERQIQSSIHARELIQSHRPDVLSLIARRRSVYHDAYGESAQLYLERTENALFLALARMAVRYGSLGADFHHYHNEDHALEILDRRLGRLLGQKGVHELPGKDWLALSLFAACHDLRQRETSVFEHGVGHNERASIAETHRILSQAGFDVVDDREIFITLEIMIAGSTFNTGAQAPAVNPAEALATSGPLAPKLPEILDQVLPAWRLDPFYVRATNLACIASDLDTANVGERFIELANSATRLAAEREMRAKRGLNTAESGQSVLHFLTQGQEHYFFELHQFCSPLGNAVFSNGKQHNAARMRKLIDTLRTHFVHLPTESFSGEDVLAVHRQLSSSI